MSRQVASSFKAVLKEFFHQRLRVGKGHKTVAQIAGRYDAEFLAQTSRGTAVVRDGHNRRYVARQLLDAAQQYGEAVPAADHRHRRPAAETCLFIDQIDETCRGALGHECSDDRADDMPRRHKHEHHAEDGDEHACNHCKPIVIAALPRVDKAEYRLFDGVDVFVVEDQCRAEADAERPECEDEQPALEAHAGIKPFDQMHDIIPRSRVPAPRSS